MEYKTKADLNSYEKIYWFLRFFVSSDKGKLHKSPQKLTNISQTLGVALRTSKDFDAAEQVKILTGVLEQTILADATTGTAIKSQLEELILELKVLLKNAEDFKALLFCIEELLIPSNRALANVPTKEATNIAKVYATEVLKVKGTQGLANILVTWDSITIDICLNKERYIASKLLFDVRTKIEGQYLKHKNGEFGRGDDYALENLPNYFPEKAEPEPKDYITSALLQEFERRLGQKRKQRSGADLEGATSFIFKFFQFNGADQPQHFNAGIEVDNWLLTKKKWYIGFSLKRTLRERWKQTRTDKDELTKFKIKYIVHLIGNHRDPADSIIGDLGAQRHIFFVPDDSPVIENISDNIVLKEYVKPMSELVSWLKAEIEK